jgi:hypothetical protein
LSATNHGAIQASATTTVPCPSLSISKTHAGSFTQGQTGATYTVTVSDQAGAGPTFGTVTVTENLPSGLNLVSMSGAGWTCPGTAANNCTRSDVLVAGASYPAIMVMVNVAPNTGSPLLNSVSVTGGGSSGSSASDSTVINVPQALRFVPVTPCRIADTRNPNGPHGGPILASGSTRDFNIPASACGIPANAAAYSLNMTVVPAGVLGYLTVWPTGQPQPLVSTLNSDGRVKANAAIVPAGVNGAIRVYSSDNTQLVIDINGYFVPTSVAQGLAFYPVTPCRVADTRLAAGTFGAPALGPNVARDFPVQSSPCGIPATAQAYALNMTVVPTGGVGFLTTWPAGSPLPVVSTLNASSGAVTANAAIVPAGAGGAISVFASDSTHLIIDVNGYFAAPGAAGSLDFFTATPCRILDTRNAAGPFGGPIMGQNETRSFSVLSSSCGVPATTKAYSLNATVVPTGGLGFLTLWGSGTIPVVSTLNSGGSVASNAAIVPAGINGAVTAFSSDPTHLILDINGYFQ